MGDEMGPGNDYTAIAVAIGGLQVRVDEGFKVVNETLKTVTDTAKDHSVAIARHDVSYQILDQRVGVLERTAPKRTPWYQTMAIVLGSLTAVAALIGAAVAITTALGHHS